MKRIIMVLIFISMCITVDAKMAEFTWDANVPQPDGYFLYESSLSGEYPFIGTGSGYVANISGEYTIYDYDISVGTWYYVLTAYNLHEDGVRILESGNSNEVFMIVAPPPTTPGSPSGLSCSFK